MRDTVEYIDRGQIRAKTRKEVGFKGESKVSTECIGYRLLPIIYF